MKIKRLLLLVTGLLFLYLTTGIRQVVGYDWDDWVWKPQPEKTALMTVVAHSDDLCGYFCGLLKYYVGVRRLPAVHILMTWKSSEPERENSERCFVWESGMRNEPLFGRFADSCWWKTPPEERTLECCWQSWGGKDKAVKYLTEQIRHYKPDVIVTHAFDGEYGHPNHMGCAYATVDAFEAANNPNRYPEQIGAWGTWQPKKLYIHSYGGNSWIHSWVELGVYEEANAAVKKCYVVEPHDHEQCGAKQNKYGLYRSTVGPDVAKNDFFEHIDLTGTPTPTLGPPTVTPTPTPVTIKQLLLNWFTSAFDQNSDGKVNSLDFARVLL